MDQVRKYRSSDCGNVGGGVDSNSSTTSLGWCGLLNEAFSWPLSAKSRSETQRETERETEREKKKGPSSGPYNLETGSADWK